MLDFWGVTCSCSTLTWLRTFARHLVGKMIIQTAHLLITIRTAQVNNMMVFSPILKPHTHLGGGFIRGPPSQGAPTIFPMNLASKLSFELFCRHQTHLKFEKHKPFFNRKTRPPDPPFGGLFKKHQPKNKKNMVCFMEI